MMWGVLLLYVGGALAVSLSLVAMARHPEGGPMVKQVGPLKASRYGLMLSMFWLPCLAYFVVYPGGKRRRRARRRP